MIGRVPGGLGSANSTSLMDEWIDAIEPGSWELRHLGVILPPGVTVTRTRSGRWRVRGQGGSRVYRAKRLATSSIWARPWRALWLRPSLDDLWTDAASRPMYFGRFTQDEGDPE